MSFPKAFKKVSRLYMWVCQVLRVVYLDFGGWMMRICYPNIVFFLIISFCSFCLVLLQISEADFDLLKDDSE